jgi:cell wall-associated NlpC family hydrolase
MQFLQATFDGVVARHPLPAGGASPPSRYNPHDAIYVAARYLCDNGAGRGDLHSAIFAYNHAEWYVQEVLDQAKKYYETTPNSSVPCPTFQSTGQYGGQDFSSNAALAAVRFACSQLGKPYAWGGNGDPGFDCSGLTHAAYAVAGVGIPRTAQTQYSAGPLLPSGTPLQPGDLVFYGTGPDSVTHVGIAISAMQMIDAPHTGADVRTDGVGRYLAASRPTAANTP